MYCPCCGNRYIKHLSNNRPVADFQCNCCNEIFELKSKQGIIGKKIPDGAYSTMISRISSETNPNLFLMQYSLEYFVTDLVFIPKFFFVPSLIEKRPPLKSATRRAGWIGCNIIYGDIPLQGKIKMIESQDIVQKNIVITKYNKVKSLETNNLRNRSWIIDVLNCINNISSNEFELADVYKYMDLLQQIHVNNHNIKAKIRQQLQLLRDRGYIEFLGNGHYRKLGL